MPLADPPELDEATTVRAAIAGEADAFAALHHQYHPMIFALAYRLCLDRAHAQDLAQETFIKAARALPAFRPDAPFRHWLFQICANTVRDWQRREGRRRRLAEAAHAHAALARTERAADFEEAREALAALAPELRAAVVLVFFEDMNHREAARVLGCAEATVSWRIFIAKRKLKTLLTRHAR